jgi:predicted AlkP superfamily pyrophosphatase or phosphodiesterase
MIPYAPTVTGCGHACIYSGSVPAIDGITGNQWWDKEKKRVVYCSEDKTVNTVGSDTKLGQMSPRNLLVTTIGDELRLATNFRSKVVGVALKDRGSILPAGHSANAAYWYDNSAGKWISSTYYMKELPAWVRSFNDQNSVNKYYEKGWSLLYPANTYLQSTPDTEAYEANVFGKGFPYDMKAFIGKDYGKIATTPMGNSLTAEFAKQAITGEGLGTDNFTDLLAISFSSTDYIGHSFGPNSVEAEDGMLRLDKDLGVLLDYLDAKIGKGQYTVFLSADHGVVQTPEFEQEHNLPAGRFYISNLVKTLNAELSGKYKTGPLILSHDNYQLALDHLKIDSANINEAELLAWLEKRVYLEPAIDRAFPLEKLNTVPMPATIRKMINNGYYPRRSGDLQLILKPGYIDAYSATGTTHGLWNPYDAHIPLLWYGWGIKKGRSTKEVYMTDIAPTLAALLRIQMPSGCIGEPLQDLLK